MMPRKAKGENHGCQSVPLDIISSLPENLIDDILMHLPLRDAARTSVLSKKWRYNWCRVPQLTLDETLWETTQDLISPTIGFTNILYHLLTLHVGLITTFTLSIPRLRICPKIDNLIYFLSRNGIQHLALQLPSLEDPYKLPSSFFACLQLRHLTLEYCSIQLPPPAFKGFDRLISLKLQGVTISSMLLENLISHSPFLQQLVLLQISGLSDVIEINAPILRSFDFMGSVGYIRLKNIPLLTKLSLTDTEPNSLGPVGKCCIAQFLESFSALEDLHLNSNSIKFLAASAGEVPTRQPFGLNCVKCLYLSDICLSDLDMVSCATYLMRSFPYLQYLNIEVGDDNEDIPSLECLEVEAFSDFTFNHLREVTLQDFVGAEPEVQLMKLLLAKSPVLVRMLITLCTEEDDELSIEMAAVLNSCRRASPEVEVVVEFNC